MDAVVRVERVVKRYGDSTVLREVSFELARGSITVLEGRSGSGKSTLFKLLGALDRPTSGSIHVEDVEISSLDDDALADLRLERIGLVFQSFNLLPGLTAEENVHLPLELAGTPRAEATRRARELLALVGLAPRAKARPNVLSGGEQQRVAIARALANRPAILLADEPTGNLDRRSADTVLRLFQDLNASLGTTILLITHDEAARERFPRRLLLDEGVLTGDAASLPSPPPRPPG